MFAGNRRACFLKLFHRTYFARNLHYYSTEKTNRQLTMFRSSFINTVQNHACKSTAWSAPDVGAKGASAGLPFLVFDISFHLLILSSSLIAKNRFALINSFQTGP